MSGDAARLAGYLTAWRSAATDVLALLRSLRPEDWSRATDLPGWDVHAVAAHLAHLESELAGNPQPEAAAGDVGTVPGHVRNAMGRFTELGTAARAGWPTDRIVAELEESVAARAAGLAAAPPDLSATADGYAGELGWTWDTLLSNRAVDLWMHGQDIRRAVGRPGALEGPAAAHVATVYAGALPYVVGKRVAPPPGTSVALGVSGEQRLTVAVEVGADGRARSVEPTADATTWLRMAFEAFTLLAGGRRRPEQVAIEVTGDPGLAGRVLAGLAVTP